MQDSQWKQPKALIQILTHTTPRTDEKLGCGCYTHLYRSMIGSLMYLTASRPDIMFAVCACARFQVTPKTSHFNAVKRIFRYLKGQPKLGLWYPRDSPFDLEAFSDSDYAGASLDRKSTTGGCQFLGKRLISWQCKKQTIVANSTTEAEYVAAANCCGQVLWIQNQMLDYGFNFMNTKIYIDNESTICIVKNPVFHSKTKHIEIRHHFIRDSYEKKLIQVIKIHTDQNVLDLLTKAFDASRVKTAKVGDEAVHKELGDRMERAATTASSLEAEQDSVNAARFNLLLSVQVNTVRHMLMLPVQVPAAEEKPAESEGFEQIVDFLNVNPIRYALIINLTIYISCIQQFWDSAKLRTVNGDVHIQALIDGKKIIVNEASIRRDLKLEDAEGSPCLPNATIFEELTRMGYEKVSQKLTFYKAFFSPQWKFLIHTILQCISAKTTAWNEFSSTMASVIICLANNQKFNFSKYIFDSMVKNLENVNKFWMYPRFVQVFVNQQLGDMSKHKKTFVNPSLTKKLFGNMKREGTGFSGKVTPLFDTMMVQASEEVGEDSDHPTDSNQIPIVDQPSTSSQPKKKQKSRRKQRKEAEVAQDETEHEESIPTPSNDPLPSGEDSMQLNDLMVLCTKLQKQVLDLEKAKSDQAIEIASLKKRVEKEDASKHGRRIEDLDDDAEITKIDEVTIAGVEDGAAPIIPVSGATTAKKTLA
ncbi:hypothetical protein Tco_1070535 [Tanacetum coccineum]|uniref:Uncharacterized protein n=1 Tax=Tanacetum coccineum TaxID=301880 RepID=A0ABQ5HLQ6_9ASTR